MIHFVFVDELPRDLAGGWCAHYDHIPLDTPGWMQCDIRATIGANQERWLDEFDEWHADLCSAALRISEWWWLMPASRPNVWVLQEMLKPLFFAIALHDWRDRNPTCVPVHLVACPQEVCLYLKEFEEGREQTVSTRSMVLRQLRALVSGIRGHCAQLVSLVTLYALRRPKRENGRVLFYSHVVRARALNESGDHFFGDMIDTVESAMPGEVIVSYLLHAEKEREQAMESLQASKRRFSFVLDYLTLWDLLWIFVTGMWANLSLVRLARVVPRIRLGHHASQGFSRFYVTEQIQRRTLTLELAIYRAMCRVLKRSGVQTVLYPYEEKALERAILLACSEASNPVRTLAYAHAANSTCHLALRTRLVGSATPPQPDKILVTGPRAQDFLLDWGRKRATKLVVVGSHRYRQCGAAPRSVMERRNGLRVLVLTGHGFELSMLANFVQRRTDLFHCDEVIIRRYDFGYLDTQNRGIERLLKLSNCFRVGAESLFDQIEWCDLALFSSTTAGLQAMLFGRLAVYVALHDILEAEPLLGNDACFARCATPDQLADALVRARTLPDSAYTQIARIQREFAASILAALDERTLIEQLQGDPKGCEIRTRRSRYRATRFDRDRAGASL